MSKPDRLALLKTLLLSMPADIGWRPCDLEQALAQRGIVVHYRVVTRDLQEIGATRIGRGRYTYHLTPDEQEFVDAANKRSREDSLMCVEERTSGFDVAVRRDDKRWDVYLDCRSAAYDETALHYVVEHVPSGEHAIFEARAMEIHAFGANAPVAVIDHRPNSPIRDVRPTAVTAKAWKAVTE